MSKKYYDSLMPAGHKPGSQQINHKVMDAARTAWDVNDSSTSSSTDPVHSTDTFNLFSGFNTVNKFAKASTGSTLPDLTTSNRGGSTTGNPDSMSQELTRMGSSSDKTTTSQSAHGAPSLILPDKLVPGREEYATKNTTRTASRKSGGSHKSGLSGAAAAFVPRGMPVGIDTNIPPFYPPKEERSAGSATSSHDPKCTFGHGNDEFIPEIHH
nr:uncharacterized protein CI109_002589 [Kwoniella shandongensis]KAA5528832.1 hypothetical protein CI109_002589 [Kwoniella shandongensis]